MPFCSVCGERIDEDEGACPCCDSLAEDMPIERAFPFDRASSFVLGAGMVVTALGLSAAAFACMMAIIDSDWLVALIPAPIVGILLLALFVVFARVRHIRP